MDALYSVAVNCVFYAEIDGLTESNQGLCNCLFNLKDRTLSQEVSLNHVMYSILDLASHSSARGPIPSDPPPIWLRFHPRCHQYSTVTVIIVISSFKICLLWNISNSSTPISSRPIEVFLFVSGWEGRILSAVLCWTAGKQDMYCLSDESHHTACRFNAISSR